LRKPKNLIKKILKKIATSPNPLAQLVVGILRFVFRFPQIRLLKFRKDKSLVDRILKIQKERGFKMWPDEMIFLYYCAKAALKAEGDFAEVGVSTAGSSRLLAEEKGNKTLYLFDTFEGLPKPEAMDGNFKEKQFAASLESVKKYLKDCNNVFFYKGLFPLSAGPIKDKKFALVHLDVDLYKSTLEALQFFYPRVVKGGIIVSHDYSTLQGVKSAFDEFFSDKREPIIELSTSQCLIVKL